MKLYLDFEPCKECNTMMTELSSPEMLFADDKTRADESAKFLRHLTYNHNEVVQAVMEDLTKTKKEIKNLISTNNPFSFSGINNYIHIQN